MQSVPGADQRRLAQLDLGGLVGKRRGVVGEEMPELRLLVVADRLLQRDRCLRAAADLLDLVGGQLELAARSPRRRLAPQLGAQLPLGAHDLVQLLDDVDRHPDRARLVGERPRDGLADPPRRVRRELEALAVVELLGGAHEPDRPLLNQIEERQALVAVALGDRDDQPQVRLDHLLLRAMLAALDALGELDLLRGGEQVDLADVLQEELQRVGGDLARLGGRLFALGLLRVRVDDLDLELLERAVELVDLPSSSSSSANARAISSVVSDPASRPVSSRAFASSVSRTSADACRPDPLPLLAHSRSPPPARYVPPSPLRMRHSRRQRPDAIGRTAHFCVIGPMPRTRSR